MTPAFPRDLMLYRAKSPDFEIRKRLQKHLSPGEFALSSEDLSQVRAALEINNDTEISTNTALFHEEVEDVLAA